MVAGGAVFDRRLTVAALVSAAPEVGIDSSSTCAVTLASGTDPRDGSIVRRM
jgi:hypothetical protein